MLESYQVLRKLWKIWRCFIYFFHLPCSIGANMGQWDHHWLFSSHFISGFYTFCTCRSLLISRFYETVCLHRFSSNDVLARTRIYPVLTENVNYISYLHLLLIFSCFLYSFGYAVSSSWFSIFSNRDGAYMVEKCHQWWNNFRSISVSHIFCIRQPSNSS